MQNADFQQFASSYLSTYFYFLVISHHVVHVFFVRRSDTSSHGAEKCISFLKNGRLHALDLGKIKKYLVDLLLYVILMKRIFENAFLDTKSLFVISFSGTTEQWENISLDSGWNNRSSLQIVQCLDAKYYYDTSNSKYDVLQDIALSRWLGYDV